jgi:hypothetical protein
MVRFGQTLLVYLLLLSTIIHNVVVCWNPSRAGKVLTNYLSLHKEGSSVTSMTTTTRAVVAADADDDGDDVNNENDYQSIPTICIPVPQYCTKPNSFADFNNYPSRLHFIYMEPLLSLEEAHECYQLAQRHGIDHWRRPDEERHVNFPTCDFAVDEIPEFESYLNTIQFTERVLNRMTHLYFPSHIGITTLKNNNPPLLGFIDLFCVQYVATDQCQDNQRMDRLEAHRDGSILSFTILLSPPENFQGGGTFFDALINDANIHDSGVIQPPAAGYAVYQSYYMVQNLSNRDIGPYW